MPVDSTLRKLRPAVWLGLGAVLVLAIILRLTLRLGFSNRDSFDYVMAAMKLNEIGVVDYLTDITNIYQNRVGIVFPLAALLQVSGVSEIGTILLPLTSSLLTIVLIFVFGYMTSVRAGFIAALIVATLPLVVGLSSAILPDSLIPFYTGASLLCLWVGLRRDEWWWFLLCGLFLFLAFQSRATSGVLIIPLVLIALWSNNRSFKAIIIPIGTFGALMGVFWLILFLLTGDWLVQYRLLVLDGTMERFAGTGKPLGYFKDTVIRLNPDFGILIHLTILAFLFALLFRLRQSEKYRLPFVAFLCLYLFFEFGSTSITTYLPIWKMSRFLTVLIVPAALLVALAADEVLAGDNRWGRRFVFILLSTQLLLGVAYVFMYGGFISEVVHVEKKVYEDVIQQLSNYDGATVASADSRWARWGPVYAAYNGNSFHFTSLDGVSRESISPETMVIFAPTILTAAGEQPIDLDQYPALDGLPARLPTGWELLFTERPIVGDPIYVYRVSGEDSGVGQY